jgi:hypothetical protein
MTNIRNLAFAAVAGVMAVSLVGCSSGPAYVPVSGVVTLNGKAFSNCIVTFQPMSTTDNPNPGRGSSGRTDQNGQFTLKCDDGRPGAAVGKHRIRIIAATQDIPPEWNNESTKEFDVHSGGTDKANFAIETKAKKK